MPTRRIEIAPSILSADFKHLQREVQHAEQAGADRIHCDVMDGLFVPNITFGPLVIEAVRASVKIPLDVHLMIVDPVRYLDAFCRAGADVLMFHAEAEKDIPGAIAKIRSHGVKPGLTVNPDKSIDLILPHLRQIDQVLIMTVYAGFGGQKFIPEMLDKVTAVQAEAARVKQVVDIEVDGGVNEETAALCGQAGVNVFVAGSYVFGQKHYSQRIAALRASAQRASGLP